MQKTYSAPQIQIKAFGLEYSRFLNHIIGKDLFIFSYSFLLIYVLSNSSCNGIKARI